MFNEGVSSLSSLNQRPSLLQMAAMMPHFPRRGIATEGHSVETPSPSSGLPVDPPARIKFKRLDKTAKHIMQVHICLLECGVETLEFSLGVIISCYFLLYADYR